MCQTTKSEKKFKDQKIASVRAPSQSLRIIIDISFHFHERYVNRI